jgi:hypothetical protein
MTATNSVDPDLAAVRADLALLRRDMTGLLDHLKAGATHRARGAVADLDEGARQLYRDAAAEGQHSVNLIGQQVMEQPVLSLLLAASLGYIGGRVLCR